MANQLNYASILTGVLQRPDRITDLDLQLIKNGEKQVIFGTHPNDNVEVWVYNPDASFAGHARLDVNDPALVISTLVDNSGTAELVNVDMRAVGQRLALEAGRYGLVLNIFRDEVGSEEGPRLFIANISQDRTEVILQPVDVTPEMTTQIYEFISPSVSRLYAKGLIDQIFGKALVAPANQIITVEMLNNIFEGLQAGILARVSRSNTVNYYTQLITTILNRTYAATIENMAADLTNYNVQRAEIEAYVFDALQSVVTAMQQSGELDPRFAIM